MSFDSLPVIIVTAKTKTAAVELVTELIDDDATDEVKPEGDVSGDRVWRLANKYYSALVRLHARAEIDAPRQHRGPVEAHVVHLASDEVHTRGAAERRLDALAWEPRAPAAVNVLAMACSSDDVPAELRATCARRRLEPVAMLAPDEGAAAARAALHAHAWPGLHRLQHNRAAPAPDADCDSDSDSDTEAGAGVEAAEKFAAALSALGGGAAHVRALQGAERRAAAEQLVAAFAALAVGHPLRDL